MYFLANRCLFPCALKILLSVYNSDSWGPSTSTDEQWYIAATKFCSLLGKKKNGDVVDQNFALKLFTALRIIYKLVDIETLNNPTQMFSFQFRNFPCVERPFAAASFMLHNSASWSSPFDENLPKATSRTFSISPVMRQSGAAAEFLIESKSSGTIGSPLLSCVRWWILERSKARRTRGKITRHLRGRYAESHLLLRGEVFQLRLDTLKALVASHSAKPPTVNCCGVKLRYKKGVWVIPET